MTLATTAIDYEVPKNGGLLNIDFSSMSIEEIKNRMAHNDKIRAHELTEEAVDDILQDLNSAEPVSSQRTDDFIDNSEPEAQIERKGAFRDDDDKIEDEKKQADDDRDTKVENRHSYDMTSDADESYNVRQKSYKLRPNKPQDNELAKTFLAEFDSDDDSNDDSEAVQMTESVQEKKMKFKLPSPLKRTEYIRKSSSPLSDASDDDKHDNDNDSDIEIIPPSELHSKRRELQHTTRFEDPIVQNEMLIQQKMRQQAIARQLERQQELEKRGIHVLSTKERKERDELLNKTLLEREREKAHQLRKKERQEDETFDGDFGDDEDEDNDDDEHEDDEFDSENEEDEDESEAEGEINDQTNNAEEDNLKNISSDAEAFFENNYRGDDDGNEECFIATGRKRVVNSDEEDSSEIFGAQANARKADSDADEKEISNKFQGSFSGCSHTQPGLTQLIPTQLGSSGNDDSGSLTQKNTQMDAPFGSHKKCVSQADSTQPDQSQANLSPVGEEPAMTLADSQVASHVEYSPVDIGGDDQLESCSMVTQAVVGSQLLETPEQLRTKAMEDFSEEDVLNEREYLRAKFLEKQKNEFFLPTQESQVLPMSDSDSDSDSDNDSEERLSDGGDTNASPEVKSRRLKSLNQIRQEKDEKKLARQRERMERHKLRKERRLLERSRLKELDVLEEEAMESDDEWAGAGGKDGEDEESDAYLEDLVNDENKEEEDPTKAHELFVEKQRENDEKMINALMDVAKGKWRKGNQAEFGLFQYNEEELYLRKREARERAKQLAILNESRLSRLVDNPKAQAFMATIAGSDISSSLIENIYHCENDNDNDENANSHNETSKNRPELSVQESIRQTLAFLDGDNENDENQHNNDDSDQDVVIHRDSSRAVKRAYVDVDKDDQGGSDSDYDFLEHYERRQLIVKRIGKVVRDPNVVEIKRALTSNPYKNTAKSTGNTLEQAIKIGNTKARKAPKMDNPTLYVKDSWQ